MENRDLVTLGLAIYKNEPTSKYSVEDGKDAFYNALLELNNGKTYLDPRDIRDGKCNGLFTLIEELITKVTIEGMPESSPIFDMVDFRNVALGDQNVFTTKKEQYLAIADIAEGTQGLRRQRLMSGQEFTVTTQLKGVKIYEEMNRLLAKRVDVVNFIEAVGRSFARKQKDDIVTAFEGAVAGRVTPYKATGSFAEAKLVELIDHVEAATGQKAVIMGSKQAIRKITNITGIDAASAKEDLYNMGYVGHVGSNAVMELENAHKIGSTEFVLDANKLYVIAADDKFIKFVTEGDTFIQETPAGVNNDMSQEYTVMQRYGIAIVEAYEFGVYDMA